MAIAVQSKTIEKTFFFQDFQVVQNGDYSLIQANNALNTAIHGQPLLPWFASSFLLPPGEEIESIEFIGNDLVPMYGEYQLMPAQYAQPISKGGSGIFVKDENIYQSNNDYPINNFGKETTSFLGGHGIGFVNYTPFVYQPKSGKLSFYRQVTVIVHTKNTERGQNALQLLSSSSPILKKIQSLVENAEDLKKYPTQIAKNDDYDFLIVTPSQFIAEFDTLIGHYLVRGLKTMVKSKEEILSEMDGQDAQEKIRNYIIQEFTNHNISYVMLGGDVEHIPYRGFYCSVQSSSVYEDDNIPSDLYYSALDGNWNTDGDGKWGEIDEDDLLPEVAVARFSFSNSSELAKMLNKTISYQSVPVLGDLGHPMMAGEHLYDNPDTEGSDYLELLIGYHDDNGYETTGIPESNNFTKLYDEVSYWSANTLMNEINQGKNFVHHSGHANENTVMKLYTSDVTNSNFAGANGIDHQFTNVYTHGCICGSFDANDCIAEYMVKIDNFAASFVGNSRYGWFNEGQTEGPSGHIHREFIDALYTDSLHRIGATHMESKYATAPWVNAPGQWEEGALRWCFYDCNVLGDPAMSIWTAEPWDIEVNYPTAITIGQTEYSVEITSAGSPVEGLVATLVMDGTNYGSNLSNANGEASISIDPVFTLPGNATLWVSGFNCTPHSYEVQVIPAEGAYVIMEACEINDESGNNNQILDYGESVSLNISLQNVGQAMAEGVTAHLTCSNADVTITNADASFGDINGNSTEMLEAAFSFSVSNDVENMTQLPFEITMVSSDNEWVNTFNIIAFAPEFSLTSFAVNDEAGNNNGRLDPGETAIFSITVVNDGGSSSSNLMTALSTDSDFIQINNANQELAALNPDGQVIVNFEIVVNETAQTGDLAHLIFNLSAGNYGAYMSYQLPIGLQVEDWESGGFSQYEWYSEGNAPWTLVSSPAYEGDFAAQSGSIGDSQSSSMKIDLNVVNADSISFFYKVSSEVDFDYLRFLIDENEMNKWSGEAEWSRAIFAVTPGLHTFTWSYTKDVSVSNGQDKAWVDYIVFPAMGLISKTSSITENFQLNLYPNPVTELAHLQFQNENSQNIIVQLIDPLGKTRDLFNQKYAVGIQNIDINLSDLDSGMYTVIIIGEYSSSSIKFIKL